MDGSTLIAERPAKREHRANGLALVARAKPQMLQFPAMSEDAHPGQSKDCYHQLRRLLIHMQIRPGTRLVEAEWAKRFEVHRTSLREAMSMLAHEGLLRRGDRGGYFSPEYDQRDLDEIWAVRSIVEAGAIRELARRGGDVIDVGPLDEAIDAMEQMLMAGYEMGFLEADRRFHQSIVEMSCNRRLIELYSHAPLPLMPSPIVDDDARLEAGRATIREHREIALLIRTNRAYDAIARLEEHLHQAHRPNALY